MSIATKLTQLEGYIGNIRTKMINLGIGSITTSSGMKKMSEEFGNIAAIDAFNETLNTVKAEKSLTAGYLKGASQIVVDAMGKAPSAGELSCKEPTVITGNDNKFLTSVTIPPVIGVSNEINATVADIPVGKKAVVATGIESAPYAIAEGTMASLGDVGHKFTANNQSLVVGPGLIEASTFEVAIEEIDLDPSKITGENFVEAAGDWGWKTTVIIPAGTYKEQTITKTYSQVLPPIGEDTATSDKILDGFKAYDADGKLIAGNMTKRMDDVLISPLTNEADFVLIPAGYYDGTIKATIDPELEAKLDALIGASEL